MSDSNQQGHTHLAKGKFLLEYILPFLSTSKLTCFSFFLVGIDMWEEMMEELVVHVAVATQQLARAYWHRVE